MATLHINLEKLITEKLDEKINDAVSKAIEKAFSNISFDFISDQNYCEDKNSSDECYKEKYIEEDKGNKIDIIEEKAREEDIKQEGDSTLEEVKKGWVEQMNAYADIINRMKSQLTEEQLEQISIPKEIISKKEYLFKLFIDNLTWEQLNLLFKNNKYLNIDIVSEDFEIQKIETYGFTPKDIYYKLLRQIITTEVNKVYHLAYSEETSFISLFIISEFNDDYNSKVVGFVNDIIDKHHMEIFDEIFGVEFYMDKKYDG